MDSLPIADHRREPRTEVHLSLTVWGIDTNGERFQQEATARNISMNGALLSGLDAELKSGDLIGILYAGRKARYRVVWVRLSETSEKIKAAVQRLIPDECPWQHMLSEGPDFAPGVSSASPVSSVVKPLS
jgi:hypothetical protein